MAAFLPQIRNPGDKSLRSLCDFLSERRAGLSETGAAWPSAQMKEMADRGVFRCFLPESFGGLGWSSQDLLSACISLSAACLCSTFVMSQHVGALKRLAGSAARGPVDAAIDALLRGERIATLGISQLSSSRGPKKQPPLRASMTEQGYVIQGVSPWVSSAGHAQDIILGATLPDRREILVLYPTELSSHRFMPPLNMVALEASCTAAVHFDRFVVPNSLLLAGPAINVLSHGGARSQTGGPTSTALALGLSKTALGYLLQQARHRKGLQAVADAFSEAWGSLRQRLLELAAPGSCSAAQQRLRSDANLFVMRITHAAMIVAKGAGFVRGHPAGQWCRQALFFQVWSNPPATSMQSLSDLSTF